MGLFGAELLMRDTQVIYSRPIAPQSSSAVRDMYCWPVGPAYRSVHSILSLSLLPILCSGAASPLPRLGAAAHSLRLGRTPAPPQRPSSSACNTVPPRARASPRRSWKELGSYNDLYKLGHQYFAEVVEFGSVNSESKEYALSIMREIRDKVISYERSLRDQRVDSHISTANFAYNPVNEDFTDDALPISLSTKGWDLTQVQSKRSRKKKLATPTVLDTLKKKTKRAYNKRRNANANTLHTAVAATDNVTNGTNVQQNPVSEGWPSTSTGAPETFPYGVETISFDLSQYNNAPSFHWPESSGRFIVARNNGDRSDLTIMLPDWDSITTGMKAREDLTW
ncbi:hypothetical protein EJB05_12466, partial [Eragrostis curvula]